MRRRRSCSRVRPAVVRRDTPPRIPVVAETVAVAADRRQAVGVDGGSAALSSQDCQYQLSAPGAWPGVAMARSSSAQADRQVVIEHCVDTRRGERPRMPNCGIVRRGLAAGHDRGRLRARRSALRRCAAAARPARRRDRKCTWPRSSTFTSSRRKPSAPMLAATRSAPLAVPPSIRMCSASPVTRIAAMPQVPTYQLLPGCDRAGRVCPSRPSRCRRSATRRPRAQHHRRPQPAPARPGWQKGRSGSRKA